MNFRTSYQLSRRLMHGLFSTLQVAFCVIFFGSAINQLRVPRTGTYNLFQALCALHATSMPGDPRGSGCHGASWKAGYEPGYRIQAGTSGVARSAPVANQL